MLGPVRRQAFTSESKINHRKKETKQCKKMSAPDLLVGNEEALSDYSIVRRKTEHE